ncbi:MAG TPA: DUF6194 family protein [Dehalococcoidia bacterium]|nr:DUF6194 family protein [Dehalococcoidia bacterium]
MDQDAITRYVANTFSGVEVVVASPEGGAPEIAWGDTFFIYEKSKKQFLFATIVTKDYGEYDCASNLDRPGVYRLNIGIGRQTYEVLFGPQSTSQRAGQADPDYDFAALDRLLPHPVYGAMSWVSVLNPSDSTFHSLDPLLAEAFELTARRSTKQRSSSRSPLAAYGRRG